MLGREHILSTVIIAITIIYVMIFQKFLMIANVITPQQMIADILTLPKMDYVYIALFFVAMVMASTAPDVDVEQPDAVVRKRSKLSSFWFTIVKYIAYLPMASLFSLSKNKTKFVGHRKIFHSVYGAIAYTISMVIIFIIVLSIMFFATNVAQNPSNASTKLSNISGNTIGIYLHESIVTIKHYWNFVLFFLAGSFIGFMAHLFEDSLTVSGITYFPLITKLGLKGRLKTGNKEFYKINHVVYLRRSKFGMIMIWVFNILFILAYSYYGLYLFSILDVTIIYLVSIFIFLAIFAGLKPAFLNRS